MTYLTISKAVRVIPGQPNPSTVWRWCTVGVGGVRLQSVRFGRRLFTTREWIKEFGAVTRVTPERTKLNGDYYAADARLTREGI